MNREPGGLEPMSELSLAGKVALVTGAGTRVGSAIARHLGREGMRVALHFFSNRRGAELTLTQIQAAGGKGILLQADLRDRTQARGLAMRAVEELGGIDLLVLGAASFEPTPLEQLDESTWDRVLSLNLNSPVALAHQAISALRERRGSIVFVTCSSVAAPFAGYLPYVVSKAALWQAARTLAIELAPEVRVNAVAPGTVMPPESLSEEELGRLVSRIPLERRGSGDDVARAVLFLAKNPFVTGHQLMVDGGRSVASARGAI